MIRDATPDDAAALAAIYNPYITELLTSFEKDPVTPETMLARMKAVQAQYPWLVCEREGEVAGYAYATRWKERHAYQYCAECAVYLRRDAGGQGLGSALYAELVQQLPACGVKVAIGCIALPNDASVALHEKFGFRKVGHFPKVGCKFGQWIDVGYWQLDLGGKTECD